MDNIVHLSSKVAAVEFKAHALKNDDAKTRFYTGLPSYRVFTEIFELLNPLMKTQGSANKVALMDEYFLTLIKLRLGLTNQDLAYRMSTTESCVSRIFHRWIDVMHNELKQLIIWPDKETLQANLPNCFKGKFANVICIIDCFEIFIERPLSFEARAATYSNYKKHNMVKFLIAVTPTGSICFLSKAWGGRASDKLITQKSGFLEHISFRDVVMADRGFNISDELAICGAYLEIPAFTKGQKQLARYEVEKTRQLATVRIHVERVIGQLKKFKLLQGTLPITLIKSRSDTTVCTIDKIVTVAAALTNMSKSIV